MSQFAAHAEPRVAEPLATVNRTAAHPKAERAGDLNTDFLRETVIYDFLWTAFHVGILSTLLNAYTRTDVDWSIRPWHHILHDSNKIMQLALRYGPEMGMSDSVRAKLLKFYDDVAAGMHQVAPLMKARANQAGAQRAHVLKVCSTWRHIAQETKSTLALIEDEVISRLGGVLHDDSRTLLEFLGEAAAGHSKRVDASSRIVLPTLKQMRRTPRLRIDGSCIIALGDRSIPARLTDVSVDGLGIICKEALPSDEIFMVGLDDGRELECRVARRDGDRIGLAFATPLHNGDLLFRRR